MREISSTLLSRRDIFASLLPLGSAVGPVNAQIGLPAPVDLGIPNILQETDLWCWAAVAQQIITWRTGTSPPQCALVARAFGADIRFCCTNRAACRTVGYLPQIQQLIAEFGGLFSAIAPPTDPLTLYRTLLSRRPVILALHATPLVGHVVVLRGMSFMQTTYGVVGILLVNDPMSFFVQPVVFQNLLPYWSAAVVVA